MTTVTRQIHFTIQRQRKRAVQGPAPTPRQPLGRIPRVSKLMALAIRFDQLLREGKVTDQSELARLAHITQPRMTQIMNLLHLAPDIQEELLHLPSVAAGTDPITERDMRPITQLWAWRSQRDFWAKLKRAMIAAPTPLRSLCAEIPVVGGPPEGGRVGHEQADRPRSRRTTDALTVIH